MTYAFGTFSFCRKACEAVSAVFREGITPSVNSWKEMLSIGLVTDINVNINDYIQAHLLVEVAVMI